MRFFIDVFEESVRNHPENASVKYYDAQGDPCILTYAELNARVNQVANYIQKKYQLRSQSCIGILQERSLDTLIMMLATWKLSSLFILLDPKKIKTQEAFIKSYVGKCKVRLISAQYKEDEIGFVRHLEGEIKTLYLNEVNTLREIHACSSENPERKNKANDIAYYIPTSGSTGEPKLCTILQGDGNTSGLNDLFEDIAVKLELGASDTALWDTPLGFDPVIAVPGWSFSRGASIFIPNDQELLDSELLMTRCEAQQVNIMLVLPTLIPKLMQHVGRLQKIRNLRILSTGEALSLGDVRALAKIADGGIWNAYGPTETPIGVTFTRVSPKDPAIGIGDPIKGRRYKIVNPLTKAEQVEGKEGEICYHCEGFGGYLGDSFETDQRKIRINGETWWRSGDFACWEVKNQFRYLSFRGRKDDQIKIAGVRIQLNTIESVLGGHDEVKKARTIFLKSGEKSNLGRIISFCEVKDRGLREEELTRYLRKNIHRLIRHSLVILEPGDQLSHNRTANGKLDKNKLIKKYYSRIFDSESNDIFAKLKAIWRDIFGIPDIDPQSNFIELGGSSMDYLTLETLVIEDDSIQLNELSSGFRRAFYSDPTFDNFSSLIVLLHNRAKRIQRIHPERRSKPLYFLGSLSKTKFNHFPKNHPIIQISLEEKESDIEELSNIFQMCDPYGPYFVCTTSQHEVKLEKLVGSLETRGKHVEVFGLIEQPDFFKKLDRGYRKFLEDQVDEKMDRVRERLMNSCVDQAFMQSTALEHFMGSKQGGQAFCLFGGAGTGKTSLARLVQRSVYDNRGSYLPIYIEKKHDPSLAIEGALYEMGFCKEEFSIVAQKPLFFIVDGLSRPEEMETVFKQKLFSECQEKRCLLTINPTVIPIRQFVEPMGAQFKNRGWEILTENHFFLDRNPMDAQEWFIALLERDERSLRECEKAQCYDRFFHYAVSLAELMGESDSIPCADIPIFDIQDKLTHQALMACPLLITEEGVQFISRGIKEYFRQYSSEKKNWPNPYKKDALDLAEDSFLLQLKLIAHIFNEHKGGGSQPLFFFPPITGEEALSPLIQHFPENQLIYSFRHPAWTGIGGNFQSIRDLAEFYIPFIRRICPSGPIALAGWSFGGTLSYEIAKQLVLAGCEINYLGILDSPASEFYRGLLKESKKHAELLLSRLNWLITTYKLNGKFEFTDINSVEEADQIFASLEDQNLNQTEKIKILIRMCRRHYRQLFEFESDNKLMPDAHLYLATQSDLFYPRIEIPALGWKIDARRTHFIENSNHFTVTQAEPAQELARKMQGDFEASWTEKMSRHFDASMTSLLRNTLQRVQALFPESYVPLECEGVGVDGDSIDTFWRRSLDEDGSGNYLLLGEAGSGKSCAVMRLFGFLAEEYLQAPFDKSIPIFIRLADFSRDPVGTYLQSGLNRAEQLYFFKQAVILIIDGIDEIEYSVFEESVRFLINLSNVKCIFTCKSAYFEHHPTLHNFLVSGFKTRQLSMKALSQDQIEHLIGKPLRHFPLVRNIFQSGELMTPTLIKLMSALTDLFQEEDEAIGLKLRRSHLYAFWLQSKSRRASLDVRAVLRFAKQLAVSSFWARESFKEPEAYPWKEKGEEFERLLHYDRYDRDKLIFALTLQASYGGLSFSHRSFLDYFLSLLIFEQIVDENLPVEKWFIKKFSLCYEHDLLSFINDHYQDYVIRDSEKTKGRRALIQDRLHRCVKASKNNPEYGLLSANALSILSACKDFRLSFPEEYQNVFIDEANLRDSNLSGLDFTGVISENAILVGTIIQNACLPSQWLRRKIETRNGLIKGVFHQNDGSLWGAYQSGGRLFKVEAWNRVCLSDSRRARMPIAALQINKEDLGHPANIIEGVFYHSDGEHYAVVSRYPDQSYRDHSDALRLLGLNHMQIFSRAGLIADYTFEYEKKPVFFSFHPNKILLFALSRFRGHGNYCSDLLVYDPNKPQPIIIPLLNSSLKRFDFNPELSILISDCKYFEVWDYGLETWVEVGDEGSADAHYYLIDGEPSIVSDEVRETRGILIINLNDLYQRTFISLREIVGTQDDQLNMSITALSAFPSRPYLAIAIKNENDNQLFVYHIQKKYVIARVAVGNREITDLATHNDGCSLMYALRKVVTHWDFSCNKFTVLFEAALDDPKLFFQKDFFVFEKGKNVLHVIPQERLREIKKPEIGHKNMIVEIVENPQFPLVASLGFHDQVIFWDTRTGELVRKIEPTETLQAESACFSLDGRYFFVGVQADIWIYKVDAFTVHVWKILPGKTLIDFQKKNSNDEMEEDEYLERVIRIIVDPADKDWLIVATSAEFLNRRGHELFRWNWVNGALEAIAHRSWKAGRGNEEKKEHSISYLCSTLLSKEVWLAQSTNPPRFYLLNQEEFTLIPHAYVSKSGAVCEMNYSIRSLLPSKSGRFMLVRTRDKQRLYVFEKSHDKEFMVKCEFELTGDAVFSPDKDQRYLALSESDSYSTEKIRSFLKIWDIQALVQNPSEPPLHSIPILARKLALRLSWTRENTLFIGTEDGDLFCYDMRPIKRGLSPSLVWSSAQDIEYQYKAISSGRFFKTKIGSKPSRLVKYEISEKQEFGFTLLGITRDEALSLLKSNIIKVRDKIQPALLQALEEKTFTKKETISRYRLMSPKNYPGYSHNLNTLLEYLDYEFGDKNYRGGWVDPRVFLAVATIKGLALQFWKEEAESLVPYDEVELEAESLHLLLQPNGAYAQLQFNHQALMKAKIT